MKSIQGTLRTKGLMLRAISDALMNPDVWIEFQHDRPLTVDSTTLWRETIEGLVRQTELPRVQFRIEGERLWLMVKVD